MISVGRRLSKLGLVLLAACGVAGAGAAELQPYQLVRSLQHLQDRLAAGDQAALPMQPRMLETIDQRLRAVETTAFDDPRNFRSLLIYGMSGGNPDTVELIVSRLRLEGTHEQLATAVVNYMRGRLKPAQIALAPLEPMAFAPEFGAFLALIKGSAFASDDPKSALQLLGQARLLGTGTLIEEAALRRSLALSAETGDAARFLHLAGDYARRFLRSPYASQFADAFVSGVMALHRSLDLRKLAAITEVMDPEQEQVIYLRIARRAAIDGLTELSAFASARAGMDSVESGEPADPRALLYSTLATLTSGDSSDTLQTLRGLDRASLTPNDRRLLDAAEAIVADLVNASSPTIGEKAPPAPQSLRPVSPSAGAGLAGPSPAETETAAPPSSAPDAAHAATEDSVAMDPAFSTAATMVSETQKKLEAIDDLLEETAK